MVENEDSISLKAFGADIKEEERIAIPYKRLVFEEPRIVGLAIFERFVGIFFEESGGNGEPSRFRCIARMPSGVEAFREIVIHFTATVVVYIEMIDWGRWVLPVVFIHPDFESLQILSPVIIGINGNRTTVCGANHFIIVGKIFGVCDKRNDDNPKHKESGQYAIELACGARYGSMCI